MYDAWMIIGEMAVNATGGNLRERLLGDNPDGTGQGWLDNDTQIRFDPICTTPPAAAHTFSPRQQSDPRIARHAWLREQIHTVLPVPIGLEALGQLYFGWGNPVAAFTPGVHTVFTTADVRAAFFRSSNSIRRHTAGVSFHHTTIAGRDNLALACCLMMDGVLRGRDPIQPVEGFSQNAAWAANLLSESNFLDDSSVAFSSWGSKLCFLKHDPYELPAGEQTTDSPIVCHVSIP
jgi:hypothetical protein